MIAKVAEDNPADLLISNGLRPGELALYVHYPGRDNYNFDAQDLSFAWLAAQRGIALDLRNLPRAGITFPTSSVPTARLRMARTPHPAAYSTLTSSEPSCAADTYSLALRRPLEFSRKYSIFSFLS